MSGKPTLHANRGKDITSSRLPMQAEKLFSILSAIQPLTDSFKDALLKSLVPLSLKKGHLLLEAAQLSEHTYFLIEGFAMAYTFEDGNKIAEAFWKGEQIIMSSHSFFEQVPSTEYIQLMEKSELLAISYRSVQQLSTDFPEANVLIRIILQRHYEHSRNRYRDIQRLSTAQRFEKLLSVFPGIEQIVPQDCIASYLGITPQSLSRLKKKRGLRG